MAETKHCFEWRFACNGSWITFDIENQNILETIWQAGIFQTSLKDSNFNNEEVYVNLENLYVARYNRGGFIICRFLC
jgi:predicted AlkP superfamily pyrophosphatase or phosphodiesterase